MLTSTLIAVSSACFLAASAGGQGGHAPLDWYVASRPLTETLAEIAEASGENPADYRDFYKSGSVTTIDAGGKTYALAIQIELSSAIPGTSAQQVVLLTPAGKILDRVRCEISTRYGKTSTEVLGKPDADGARIVVRFVGRNDFGRQSLWHNWHEIRFHGNSWIFQTVEREAGAIKEWNDKGLCRIGIADDKLTVLFPKLEAPQITKATSLRIGYRAGGAERELVLDDPKKVAELLSTIAVRERRQLYPEPAERDHISGQHSDTMVDFLMPGGTKTATAFVTDRLLVDSKRGWLKLENDRFYKAIAEAVSRAEGHPVDLLQKAQ